MGQRAFVSAALRGFVRLARMQRPTPVVVITGSVGKTTTKECTAAVLRTVNEVRRTPGNHNCLTGVPSTLLGVSRPQTVMQMARRLPGILRSVLGGPPPADYLVLEVGTLRPGQIRLQLSAFTPQIAVVTAVAPVHLETLGSLDAITHEKRAVVEALPADGYAVLCYDDERVRSMAAVNQGSTIYYGFGSGADVRMTEPDERAGGMATVLSDSDGDIALHFPHVSGRHLLYAAMAAWCVGRLAGVPRQRIADAIQAMSPEPGRGSIEPGPRDTLIFDDSFSASPIAMAAALRTFDVAAGSRRRILVLGEMLELGDAAEALHRSAGRDAASIGDAVLGVGDHARFYVEEFTSQRPGAPAWHCKDAAAAAALLGHQLQAGDALFVKGSHRLGLSGLLTELRKQLSSDVAAPPSTAAAVQSGVNSAKTT